MSQESRVHLSRSAPATYQALGAFSKTVGELSDAAGVDDRLKELVQIHTSQLNGCAYCVRVHVERAVKAGITADTIAQLPVWRESGVFSDRERAGLELAESFAFISEEGVSDEVYDRVGGVLTEQEYVALSWILVAINAFNRVAIAGRYSVPPGADLVGENRDAAAGRAW
ncbi:carboxymuconolactone decarboxylase family protein [Microbacterium sp. BWT-B31]|uniref:carboxymuconolactone decarboxylase family protein n=1 Tax=Microbacterium sp. BWT-B31 TaxID=3232072 RepID=UPI003527725F